MVPVPVPVLPAPANRPKLKTKAKLKLKLIQVAGIGKKPKIGKQKGVSVKNAKKFRKGAAAKSASSSAGLPPSSTARGDKLQVVPWASSSEWEQVCALYNNGEYGRVIAEIRLWSQRVPAVPIGVESTLYLLQAIQYDANCNARNTDKTEVQSTQSQWCEEVARSLYSLAIIRYLNHVSHLATREIADQDNDDGSKSKAKSTTSTLPMSKLAAHINVPEWIVNLRHEASHGANVPSLEVLRLAAEFVRTWLKENYWIPRSRADKEGQEGGTGTANSKAVLKDKSEAQEAEFARTVIQHIAAFVAARVYKLRQTTLIIDPEIVQLTQPPESNSVGTNQAILLLKSKIAGYLRSDPARTCSLLAGELVPPLDVYQDLGSIFRGRERSPFEALTLIWSPVFKLLQKKPSLLYSVLGRLAEMHADYKEEEICSVQAQWIDKILEMVQFQEGNAHGHSADLQMQAQLRTLLMAAPKPTSRLFLDRVHAMMESHVGVSPSAVHKLAELNQIWIENGDDVPGPGNSINSVIRKTVRGEGDGVKKLFTIEDIENEVTVTGEENATEPPQSIPFEAPKANFMASASAWSRDPRSSAFWSRVPIGAAF